MPIAAEYFIGTVDDELVCHLAVAPMLNTGNYRATRLVVMPEWQGAGVGTKFLNWVCQYHLDGNGRKNKKYPVLFHTSHPQLISYLRHSSIWVQKSGVMFGGNKRESHRTIKRANKNIGTSGYGGHFRSVQGFKYIGKP